MSTTEKETKDEQPSGDAEDTDIVMTGGEDQEGTQGDAAEEKADVECALANDDCGRPGASDRAKLNKTVKNLESGKTNKGKVMTKSKGILKNKKDKGEKNYKTQAKAEPGKKIYPGKHHITEDHEDKKPKTWAIEPITEKKKKRKKGVKFDVPKAFACSISNVVQLDSAVEEDNPFISCDGGCKLQALKKCLGSLVEINDELKTFTCLLCQRKAKKLTTKCVICGRVDVGLYTKLADEDDKFIHYTCGLLCDNFEIKDLKTMEFTQTSEIEPQEAVNEEGEDVVLLACRCCGSQDGYLLKCLKRRCDQRVHPSCLSEEILSKRIKTVAK